MTQRRLRIINYRSELVESHPEMCLHIFKTFHHSNVAGAKLNVCLPLPSSQSFCRWNDLLRL